MNNIGKINTLGKAGDIICRIGKILMIIAAVASLVGFVLICLVPKEAVIIELNSMGTARVQMDETLSYPKVFDLDISDGVLTLGKQQYQVVTDSGDVRAPLTHTFYFSNIKWICLAGVLAAATGYLVLYYAGRLCAEFRSCKTPFTEAIAADFIRLAWSLVPFSILTNTLSSYAESMFSGRVQIMVTVDIATVILVLGFIMLSFIFKYGVALQTESDETL